MRRGGRGQQREEGGKGRQELEKHFKLASIRCKARPCHKQSRVCVKHAL